MIPRLHLPSFNMDPARLMADRVEEHAVSMLTDGPGDKEIGQQRCMGLNH